MSRLTMMPPSHAATSSPPKRGVIRTTRPATISTTPTMCMASAALPGRMSLNGVARYRVQSSVRTSANLSIPNRIGATTKTIRISRKAWATGSRRAASRTLTRPARGASVAMALMWRSPRGGVSPGVATAGRRFLRAPHQREQARVVLAAGGAALEVRAQAGHAGVGVLAGHFGVDVLVEPVEALLAGRLGALGPEQAGEHLAVVVAHVGLPSESAARSLRRAS